MEKDYIVLTPLKIGGDKKGEFVNVSEGERITLDEAAAAPLLEAKALREPDPAPTDSAKAAKK
ncbi:hypothetical protein [uncultured Herbaspirillum sp.]|uniref:hypothetical protein n=1 Tax=uncultured Herbaspirillum sp. TaxID=160236 RepID=UPI0026257880|nr:hypothetical protein [uncultured Herbaspirillum sp.]